VRCIRNGPPTSMSSQQPNAHYKWVVVAVMWLIACLNYTDRMTIFSVLPVLKREMGFPDVVLALLGSTFLWAYAICSPIGGYLGDRFSRRKVIITSLFLFSLVTFATGLAYWNRLFHQKPDGTFENVTEKSGLQGFGYGMEIAVGDYDNDGWPDIYVANYGKNRPTTTILTEHLPTLRRKQA
jgi:MFS family permease